MVRIQKQKISSQAGFTLMEVTIAVVILAASLVTLLGLQSSIIRLTLRDDERQHSMLLARSILSAMEVHLDEVEPQDRTATAEEVLKGLNITPPEDFQSTKESLFKLSVHIVVDNWSIPKVGDDIMKRIRLSIFSDSTPDDAFEVLYFVPNIKDGEEG